MKKIGHFTGSLLNRKEIQIVVQIIDHSPILCQLSLKVYVGEISEFPESSVAIMKKNIRVSRGYNVSSKRLLRSNVWV